jgi:hypothetical protein
MIRRGIFLLALVYAGCKGHKNCGDGSVAVPSEDPDGGMTCVAEPNGDGGDDGPHLPPMDAHGDSHADARVDGPPGGFCGDGICNSGESCSTCPTDCGSCCGNGICDNGETCSTCPSDCVCPPDAAPPDAGLMSCPTPLSYSGMVTASTAGFPHCTQPTLCATGTTTGPDVIYQFVPTVSGSCHAQTTFSTTTLDTILMVRTSELGTDLACNDDNGMNMTPSLASYVTWTATAFTTYYIFVTGFNNTSGTYTLQITCP